MQKFLLSLVATSAIFYSVDAQTSYSFEASEGFVVGNIVGQKANINSFRDESVSVANTAVVTSERASTGVNSLQLLNDDEMGDSGVYIYNFPSYSKPSVSFDFYVPELGGSDTFLYAFTAGGALINIDFNYQGDVRIANFATQQYETAGSYVEGAWNNLRADIDFSAREIKYYLNGVLVKTGAATGTDTSLVEIDFAIDNFGSDTFIDNVQIKDANLAVQESGADKAFRIYPNPAVDVINFELNSKVISTEVYDAAGKSVKTINGDVKSVDVSALPKGVYVVKVKTAAETFSKKVIKK